MVILLVQRGYVPRVMSSVRANFDQVMGRADRIQYLERFGRYGRNSGYSARANAELAAHIRANTTPDDRVYVFGINAAELYFETDRLSAHRFLRVNFYVPTEFPDPAFRLNVVAADLAARPPRYLVFENLHNAARVGELSARLAEAPELETLMRHYRLETVIEDFTVYRRVD